MAQTSKLKKSLEKILFTHEKYTFLFLLFFSVSAGFFLFFHFRVQDKLREPEAYPVSGGLEKIFVRQSLTDVSGMHNWTRRCEVSQSTNWYDNCGGMITVEPGIIFLSQTMRILLILRAVL